MYSTEYGGILLGLILCLVLAIVFAGLSYVVSAKAADVEKVSAYECGFDPFDDTRKAFDVRFYLVAILFLIFDLEVLSVNKADQKPLAGTNVELLNIKTGKKISKVTGADGKVNFDLNTNTDYTVLGSKQGFFSNSAAGIGCKGGW